MRNFILGTDWGEDCDDAVALRLLARASLNKEIKLIAVGINTHTEYSAPSAYVFLENEGYMVPIGVDKNCPKTDWQNRYQPRLAKRTSKRDDDFEDSVRVYRRAIAEAEGKVEILEVGFLQVLSAVLESQGDDISPLSGLELFKKKVEKVWIMGGKWDEDAGREFNFSYVPFACVGAHKVCKLCPCPITFLGWEIGAGILTGDTLEQNDMLRQAIFDWGSDNGRESWDPMLCLMAIIGDEEKAGYNTVCGKASVDFDTGRNHFIPSKSGKHKYVVKKFDNSYYKDAINSRIK